MDDCEARVAGFERKVCPIKKLEGWATQYEFRKRKWNFSLDRPIGNILFCVVAAEEYSARLSARQAVDPGNRVLVILVAGSREFDKVIQIAEGKSFHIDGIAANALELDLSGTDDPR